MKIKELRENTGKNPAEIAKVLNISVQSYYRYETKQNEPNIKNLKVIADMYGVSLDYLCDHKVKNQDLGYLTQEQILIIKLAQRLNEQNIIKTIGYLNGLLASQQ